jgi:hypothetical protein
MAKSGSASKATGNYASTQQAHDQAHLKNSKDLVGAEAARAKQANDEITRLAKDLMSKSKTFTLRGLVEETVGETIKDVADIQAQFQKKLKKLQEEHARKEAANKLKSSEQLVKQLARLEDQILDLQETFHDDLDDAKKGMAKAEKDFLDESKVVGKLQGTRIGKLLEKQNRNSKVKETMERRREFLANRKELMQGIRNQIKVAETLGNVELAGNLGRQLQAAHMKDILAFERFGEVVESHIGSLDSKFTRSALEQAKALSAIGKHIGGGVGRAVVGMAGRTVHGVSTKLFGSRLTGIATGVASGLSRGVGKTIGYGVGKFQDARMARALMAPVKAIGGGGDTTGTGELSRMASAENNREEITELRNIVKAIDRAGGKGGKSLLDTVASLLPALLGGAGFLTALSALRAKLRGDKTPKDKTPPDDDKTPKEKGAKDGKTAPEGSRPSDTRSSEDVKSNKVVDLGEYKDARLRPQGSGLPEAANDAIAKPAGNSVTGLAKKVPKGLLKTALNAALKHAPAAVAAYMSGKAVKDYYDGKTGLSGLMGGLADAGLTAVQMATVTGALALHATELNTGEAAWIKEQNAKYPSTARTQGVSATIAPLGSDPHAFTYNTGASEFPKYADTRRVDMPAPIKAMADAMNWGQTQMAALAHPSAARQVPAPAPKPAPVSTTSIPTFMSLDPAFYAMDIGALK